VKQLANKHKNYMDKSEYLKIFYGYTAQKNVGAEQSTPT